MSQIYQFQVKRNDESLLELSEFKGKYMLIVNTASKCGFTPQYDGLQSLFAEFQDKLVVLAFPCNQFGKQEPGSADEIKSFCEMNFNIQFPIMSKVDVNGDKADPLFEYLKSEAPGLLGSKAIKWNFTKFLVSDEGKVLKRFAPTDAPKLIKDYLVKELGL